MNAAEWLRFAGLSLLGAWIVWRLYRREPVSRGDAWLPAAAAMASAGQLALAAEYATDPFTPWSQTLPAMLVSPYGALSVTIVVLGLAVAAWLVFASVRPLPASVASVAGLTLLVLAGAAAAAAQPALTALASSGQIVMTPTLAVPRSALSITNPYGTDSASASRGKVVYQQNCEVCHGINGDGNGPAGANLRIKPPTFHNPAHFLAPGMDAAHFWVVQHGDGQASGMPAWQGKLTDQQTWDAIDYIKAIAAGKAVS